MADGVQGDALQARTALEHLRIASEAAQSGSDGTGVYAHTQVSLRYITLCITVIASTHVKHIYSCSEGTHCRRLRLRTNSIKL
jgi:hypothetical protein